MTKNQKDRHDQQSDRTVNRLTTGDENTSVLPEKPLRNLQADLTAAEESGEFDSTLYDEESPIFNYY